MLNRGYCRSTNFHNFLTTHTKRHGLISSTHGMPGRGVCDTFLAGTDCYHSRKSGSAGKRKCRSLVSRGSGPPREVCQMLGGLDPPPREVCQVLGGLDPPSRKVDGRFREVPTRSELSLLLRVCGNQSFTLLEQPNMDVYQHEEVRLYSWRHSQ